VGAPRSSLRASQTFNDLGKSLEKDEGEKEFEPDCGQGSISTGFATSRIPSPTFDTKEHIRERRYVSTPVLPSQKKEVRILMMPLSSIIPHILEYYP
jgi:hypothetical protein